MRTVALSLGLAACLGALYALMSVVGDGALLAAPTSVAIGVLGAAALHGRLDSLAVSLGAPSALAWTWLSARGRFELGAAACLALWTAPGLIARGARRETALPAGLAVAAAWLGGQVLARYLPGPLEAQAAACVFAGAATAMATTVVAPSREPVAPPAEHVS